MKKLAVIVMMLLTVNATMAEGIPFTVWLEQQTAAAEQSVAQDEPLEAEDTPMDSLPEEAVPEFDPIGVGSRGETAVQLQTKLIELGFLNGKADGIFGPATEGAVRTVQKALGWEETGVIQNIDELNAILALVPGDGVNLAIGTSDEWSEWMTPEYDVTSKRFVISNAYLGEKQVGDYYTCQVEIEFSDVTSTQNTADGHFRFIANGQVDNTWGDLGDSNIWKSIVDLDSAPANEVYRYTATKRIYDKNVDSNIFQLGFQCEYWASGQFRVRRVKVEKGIIATSWSPSDADVGDGINLAAGTSSEWSEWFVPEYNVKNQYIVVSTANLGEKRVADPYTCQVEIEFVDVAATQDIEDGHFRFIATGRVDDSWGELGASNIWRSLVSLDRAPANGVYRYTTTKMIVSVNVDASIFELGFVCDYWASGKFRVRCVKVEKGAHATEWTPAR